MIHAMSELAPGLSVTLRLANAALHAGTPACYGASASWKPVWSWIKVYTLLSSSGRKQRYTSYPPRMAPCMR